MPVLHPHGEPNSFGTRALEESLPETGFFYLRRESTVPVVGFACL
jgi:hypothetical protein